MPDLDLNAVATKLTAARTKLILDKPFLGALVLRLPMLAADDAWCPTTGTDAKNFYYNPAYIDSLSLAQTQFMLAHEALHCALSHFARREHREIARWNMACDFAINPLLVADGLTPPYNAQIMDEYEGMTAEEIYPLIKDNENEQTLDQHLYDQDSQGNSGVKTGIRGRAAKTIQPVANRRKRKNPRQRKTGMASSNQVKGGSKPKMSRPRPLPHRSPIKSGKPSKFNGSSVWQAQPNRPCRQVKWMAPWPEWWITCCSPGCPGACYCRNI